MHRESVNSRRFRRKESYACFQMAVVSKRRKRPSCHSLMARGVRFQAWLCRICGCFFIHGLFSSNDQTVPKVVWKSWYILYSCACMAFLLWVDIVALIAKAGGGNQLNNALKIIMHILLFIRMVLTLNSMILGSPKLVAFYIRAASFERHIGMTRCNFSGSRQFFWLDVRRAIYFVFYCTGFLMTLPNPPPYRPSSRAGFSATMEVYFWSKLTVLTVFCFVYDSICTAVLTRSCQVLQEYTESQVNVLRACLGSRHPGASRAVDIPGRIEEVRRNLFTVRQLKDEINDIWHWPLVVTTACVIVVMCRLVYDIAENDVAVEHFSIVLYAGCAIYDFAALASASQSLTNTTKKIKDECNAVRNTEDPNFRRQVRLLHDWVTPEDMAVRGGDFFTVNLTLLVHIAASVVTHSVILLQTDQMIGHSRNETSRGFFSVGS